MPLVAGAKILHRLEDRRDAAEAVGDSEEVGEMKTADHREMSGRRPHSHNPVSRLIIRHCSSFIVHRSFVIAGDSQMQNERLTMNNVVIALNPRSPRCSAILTGLSARTGSETPSTCRTSSDDPRSLFCPW